MDAIKAARKRKGWTQEQLADAIGVKRAVISKYENGVVSPSLLQLQNIADALEVDFLEVLPEKAAGFFMGFNRAIETRRAKEALSNDEKEAAEDVVLDILGYLDELDAYGQERAVACVRAITGRPLIDEGQGAQAAETLLTTLYCLNEAGQQKAVERVEELTEIPKYQRKAPPPDSPPAPLEDE